MIAFEPPVLYGMYRSEMKKKNGEAPKDKRNNGVFRKNSGSGGDPFKSSKPAKLQRRQMDEQLEVFKGHLGISRSARSATQ